LNIDSEIFQMTWTDPTPSVSGPPELPSQTFCIYLARQFIAKKGFGIARAPELERLAAVSDIVLTQSDGYRFNILCMIDRETYPGKIFNLGVEELREIGEACLKYTGKINRRQMPVSIGVIEVGPGSAQQQLRLDPLKRSSLLAKVTPFAMTVDTRSGEVWSSTGNWFTKGPHHGFVEKLLTAPYEVDADLMRPPAVAVAPSSFPVLTTAILAVLFAVFAAEIQYGIGPWSKALEPTIATLVAFGGLAHDLVLQSGQWYRLFSAPFLHLDAGHLAMNAIALFIAGRSLEGLVGRAWFGAAYVIGALGGSLLSLAWNPPMVVAVGASGAIMGLFVAMLVVSLHFPPGVIRTNLQMSAAYVLIPSLLPLAGALKGHKVDYAAHFGGAIGGALAGLIMLAVWSQAEPRPHFRRIAAAIAIAGVIVLAYPITAVLTNYSTVAFITQLIPFDKLPKTNADMRARAAQLVAQYPYDPRPRFVRAGDLLDANDPAGAEREARAGLAQERLWRPLLSGQTASGLRIVLALAINKDRPDEARSTIRPACADVKDGPMRKRLNDQKLCDS
jgi:rhomboid protease GluP